MKTLPKLCWAVFARRLEINNTTVPDPPTLASPKQAAKKNNLYEALF